MNWPRGPAGVPITTRMTLAALYVEQLKIREPIMCSGLRKLGRAVPRNQGARGTVRRAGAAPAWLLWGPWRTGRCSPVAGADARRGADPFGVDGDRARRTGPGGEF